eukprot:gnl/MRDRNA2_/MRDRNA2_95620_c0_seq1.p1 gnl/MRDRNA2_/MRDRNA2_95620_c0~~gnl/MRDRNA2_/MRDRNA2_95620_c0_seq1.p1  ORF type:complete len:296 (+),score=97.34 gnl/MRDRNA2_/MRDRNA2_95620_c0_seq1:134-1021(+)
MLSRSVRVFLFFAALEVSQAEVLSKKKHHHKHHKHHEKSPAEGTESKANAEKKDEPKKEEQILGKMKTLEKELAKKEEAVKGVVTKGRIEVNGPLPANFAELFSQGAGKATGAEPSEVKVVETNPVSGSGDVVEVVFEAPADVVKAVEDQAADPDSKLATGNLKEFLVAKDATEATPVQEKGIDVDTEMPYGELEPFGREDTAQELTESSIKESDEMVDQLERAEVAEEKRAVFRALTRLRGAAITSFDGVARSQTGNIDEYNKTHKWRKTHPLHHLADEESDISKWAFPDNADF